MKPARTTSELVDQLRNYELDPNNLVRGIEDLTSLYSFNNGLLSDLVCTGSLSHEYREEIKNQLRTTLKERLREVNQIINFIKKENSTEYEKLKDQLKPVFGENICNHLAFGIDDNVELGRFNCYCIVKIGSCDYGKRNIFHYSQARSKSPESLNYVDCPGFNLSRNLADEIREFRRNKMRELQDR